LDISDMGVKLYLLRHGETTYSRSGGFCGDLDPELTPVGMAMAEAFAEAYGHHAWTAAYVSPMLRTQATARPLCIKVGLEMQLRPGLREIRYGDWEGQTPEQVKANDADAHLRWMTEPAWNAPTGGETAVDVAVRAMAVITEIEDAYGEGDVLIVSHKATIRILLCSLLGIDLGRYRDRLEVPAASLSVVTFGRYGPQLLQMGDRSYLPPELREVPGT
jgi:broad specificity phosphatase PhoE